MSNNGLRLLLATPHFWPQLGGEVTRTADLATSLAARGCDCTILSVQPERTWPAQIDYRGIPVERLLHSPRVRWGHMRYHGLLRRYVQKYTDLFDAVCVCGLGQEAYSIVGALRRSQVPVVLRAWRAGPTGDVAGQSQAAAGWRWRRRAMQADAIVHSSDAVEAELRSAGYPAEQLERIEEATFVPPRLDGGRRAVDRLAARASLADVNPLLAMPEHAPLVVCPGRLREGKELLRLVDVWRKVIESWPHARLWLCGQGPLCDALRERIDDRGLPHRVLIPGGFDSMEDVYRAADMLLCTRPEQGTPLALLEGMAAGLPIVASPAESHLQYVRHDQEALITPADDTAKIVSSVLRLLDEPETAGRLAAAAYRRAVTHVSLADRARQYEELFRELIAMRATS